jgi:hypothetical protein
MLRKYAISLKRIPVIIMIGVRINITDKYAIFCKGLNRSWDEGVNGLCVPLKIVKE